MNRHLLNCYVLDYPGYPLSGSITRTECSNCGRPVPLKAQGDYCPGCDTLLDGQNTIVEVGFYRASDKPYGRFSNLFRSEIQFEGQSFPTAEHAFQYGKPRRDLVRDWLMQAPSPSILARSAHELPYWEIRKGWSKDRVARMRAVLRAKFEQHPELLALLLSTGSHGIVEVGSADNDVNRFWGRINRKGELIGRNHLGILLMELRDALRTGDSDQAPEGPSGV